MRSTIVTFDGTRVAFDSSAIETVIRAKKTGEMIEIGKKGQFVAGSDIRRIEAGDTESPEYGPHLAGAREDVSLIAAAVFDTSKGEHFWQGIIRRNMAAQGTHPWRFRAEVNAACRELGSYDPDRVMDFLESATVAPDGLRPLRPSQEPAEGPVRTAEAAVEAAA